MNDELMRTTTTQSADDLTSPTTIESRLKNLTFDEWRELLYNFPQFTPRYSRMLRPECWKQMWFVPQQFAVSSDWVLSNGGNWAKILDEKPILFREKFNWAGLTGSNWAWLLKWKPELQDLCDWNKLNNDDWESLLGQHPEYTNKRDWTKLGGKDWSHWLGTAPEFSDRCNWDKLDHDDWYYLLQRQPQFINKLSKPKLFGKKWLWVIEKVPVIADEIASRLDWDMLNADDDDLMRILAKHPEYGEKFGWHKLSGSAWGKLLCKWAQLSIDISSEIMAKCRWESLAGKDWVMLLKRCPQYVGKCDWTKLSTADFVELLIEFPVNSIVAENCNWSELESWPSEWLNPFGDLSDTDPFGDLSDADPFSDLSDTEEVNYAHEKEIASWWDVLLDYRPEYAKYRNWRKVYGEQWEALHNERPEIFNKRGQITLDGNGWVKLISENSQYGELCKWEKLDGEDWCALLSSHPHFAEKCAWKKLQIEHWFRLLSVQPQFGDRCPWKNVATAHDWALLLSKQPQFLEQFIKAWCINGVHGDSVVGDDKWTELLIAMPEMIDQFPEVARKCDWSHFTGGDWSRVLSICPQLEDKCDWQKLSYPTRYAIPWRHERSNWHDLLLAQPQFAGKCDWSRIDQGELMDLLENQPAIIAFCDNCVWERLSGKDWYRLLSMNVDFAKVCRWDRLDGNDWVKLLKDYPEFASHCKWSVLDGSNWSEVLCEHPELFEGCEWEKLNGENWVNLLRKQPQFAYKCDWEKLYCCFPEIAHYCWEDPDDSVDQSQWFRLGQWFCWASLLAIQAQFADKCDWERLSGKEWAMLLRSLPQYADKCDWGKLYEQATVKVKFESGGCCGECEDCGNQAVCRRGYYEEPICCWCVLLLSQPQFADKCDWSRLDGKAWSLLLSVLPKYADKCDWNSLTEHDWRCLLKSQPQFRTKLAETLGESRCKEILPEMSPLAHPCQTGYSFYKAKGIDLLNIVEHSGCHYLPGRPYLQDLVSELKQSIEYRRFVFNKQEEGKRKTVLSLLGNCPQPPVEQHEFDGVDWSVWLCMISPKETANATYHYRMQESDWDKLDGKDWVGLLRWKPNLAKYCRWSKLDGSNWGKLLGMYPEFAEKCDWEKTKNWTSRDWAMLIRSKPEYATYERMQIFTGSDWAIVLSRQPGLAKDEWLAKLQGSDWVSLIWSQPQFAEKCDWRKLNTDDWIKLLKNQPEFADKCNFASFKGSDILKLAFAIPKFTGLCNLERLYESTGSGNDVHSWFADLLITDRWEISRLGIAAEIEKKCDWGKLSEQDLPWIMRKCLLQTRAGLIQRPIRHQDSERLANATWSDLTGEDIVHLLSSFPQLSTKVDLTKLTVSDWIDLLCSQPNLINKCGHLKPQIEEEMRRREKKMARERYEYENDDSSDDWEDDPYYVDGVPVYGAEDQEDADILYWNTH